MKIIKIQALDTLFFRDGKPFSMGEETTIETKLIPFPSVFWGAIFTRLLVDGKVKKDGIEKLSIGRIFMCDKNGKLSLPTPNDLFFEKKKEKEEGKKEAKYAYKYGRLEVIDTDTFVSKNIDTNFVLMPDTTEEVIKKENSFMSLYSFKNYQKKFSSGITINFIDEIIDKEVKIGIKRDNSTNTTEEGNLYRIPMLRFNEGWSYLVEYELEGDLKLEKTGILKLGGEGKTVNFREYENSILEITQEISVEKDEFFKIYASSPLILKGFNFISWTKLFNSHLKNWELVSVCNFAPLSVGGWDLKERKPKKMKKALPAGSVFVFKNLENTLKTSDIQNSFRKLLSETETRFGFNQFEILK